MLANYIDVQRVSHGIKTALACLIGFGVTRLFYAEIHQWLIITIIVVMCAQLSVGSVIQKSYMRFIGTLIGSIIATLTIVFFQKNELAYAIVIAISSMFFSYIATGEKSYAESGTLGAVTVVIILISVNPTLTIAVERFFEISLGILIAALVSQLILPVHARKHLREIQAKTIRQLRTFYLINQVASNGVENFEDYQNMEEGIAQLLIKQRKLSVEAAREWIGEEFKSILFQQLLRAERGIFRSITVMHYIEQRYKDIAEVFDDNVLKSYEESISTLFEEIALCIETDNRAKIQSSLPDLDIFKKHIFGLKNNLSDENLEYVHAYLFSIEMLIDHLNTLVDLVNAD